MTINNILIENFFFKSKNLEKNLIKTKKTFKVLSEDIKKLKIPLLKSYEKNYKFSFSKKNIKKFLKYKNIVIIGMGGSILGTKCIHSFFREKIKKNVFFFDNLDENLHFQYNQIKNIKNSCFIVISKSGNTLETLSNFLFLIKKTTFKNKLVFITEIKDSAAINIAKDFNAEIIEHKNFIGGRYSVLSEAGMFPSSLMGLNIKKFKNLKKLIKNKKFVSSLIRNVAFIYTLNKNKIRNSVVLNYDSDLENLGYWYQQLVGESLGKKGKGIMPILSSTPKDHHSLFQLYLEGPSDKFFTFFSSKKEKDKHKITSKHIPKNMKFLTNKKLKSLINAQCDATKNIFKKRNIHYRHFLFNKKNEEELGSIFTFFVLETILLARLMKIDPFNQPAVEKIKLETRRILSI